MFDLVSMLVIMSLLVTSVNQHITMAINHLNSWVFLLYASGFLGSGRG